MTEHIIAAAVQIEGTTISLPQPARHAQVLFCLDAMGVPDYHQHSACQGFLTSTGRFVNRVEAYLIARRADQEPIRDEHERHPTQLFSEDLW